MGKEFAAPVAGVFVVVDNGADQRVVDGIPYLHKDQQDAVDHGIHFHELSPENGHGALQGEAHITAKVTGCIGEAVANTKGMRLGRGLFHRLAPKFNSLFSEGCIYFKALCTKSPVKINLIQPKTPAPSRRRGGVQRNSRFSSASRRGRKMAVASRALPKRVNTVRGYSDQVNSGGMVKVTVSRNSTSTESRPKPTTAPP